MTGIRKVAVVEGDGIGKEVVPVAKAALGILHPEFDFFDVEVGYGVWSRTGEAVSDDGLAMLRESDAVLFGAVSTPPSPDYRSVVVRLRKELDLFANIRPVWGEGFRITVVRENLEGLYSGIEEIGKDRATTLRLLTRQGCTRIAACACRLAMGKTLTIGHKANVLKSDTLFRDICMEQATRTGVRYNERYIDALCLDVLQHPGSYDVIVTTNMFGDILSDVTAYLVGGLGMLPSANLGDRHSLFEPVHGSAPDIAGNDVANPVAALRSAAMLLRHAGDRAGGEAIERAIQAVILRGVRTRDLGGTAGTRQFGDAVLAQLSGNAEKI